jgi:hypothetical protein
MIANQLPDDIVVAAVPRCKPHAWRNSPAMPARGRCGLAFGLVRHECLVSNRPEADAGRNGVVAHLRLGMVPAIAALWVGLIGRPLQRVVAHIFVPPDFVRGLGMFLARHRPYPQRREARRPASPAGN